MSKNLKVEILKKSKEAPYPEHITIRRDSTGEFAHLYFDKGNIKRMTYLVHNPKLSRDELKMDYCIQNGQFHPTISAENLSEKIFFVRTISAIGKRRSILFFDENAVAVCIKTDLNGQCLSDYISNYNAEITCTFSTSSTLSVSHSDKNIINSQNERN